MTSDNPAGGYDTGTRPSAIDVLLNGQRIPLDEAVFVALLENSVARTYAAYGKAVQTKSISFSELVDLARHGEIPYALFFAPLTLVEAQINANTSKLLSGLSKDTFSVNSRTEVNLRDVELIVKDLLRKQELLKKHDDTLVKNKIVGLLRKPGDSVEADATRLMTALGLTHEAMCSAGTKAKALEHLVDRLEANQVLVSQSVNNFMPQRLVGVDCSGMTIRDAKVPYIFLAGGDFGDYQEPVGRRIFTLTLMSVLIARRIFAPVTYDGNSIGSDHGREYDIVGEILMPRGVLLDMRLTCVDEIKDAADVFKVTPSAVAVRAMRIGMLDWHEAASHLAELAQEFSRRVKPQSRQPRPVNAIRKYNGREFSVRMIGALDAGKISAGEFCRVVCLNRIKPTEINDFRSALS